MRGRTNIGGGGIAINATVEQKTIKSGNIIAGDFVEYFSEPKYITQSRVNFFEFNMGDYIISLQSENYDIRHTSPGAYIALFKEYEQVDIYTDFVILAICKYNNFIVFLGKTDIGVLRINSNTDKIELVQTIPCSIFSNSTYDDYFGITAENGIIVAFTEYTYNTPKYNFAVVNISNAGVLSDLVISSSVQPSSSWGSSGVSDIEYYNGNFCLVGNNCQCAPITIDNDRKVTITYPMNYPSLVYTTKQRRSHQTGSKVFYTGYYSSGGSTYVYKIIICNLINYAFNVATVVGTPITNIDNGFIVTQEKISDTSMVLRLYYFNETTEDVILLYTSPSIETEASLSTQGSFWGSVLNGDIANIMENYSYKNLRKMKIVGDSNIGLIEDLLNPDYVIPYVGEGHPIGVAKDNGTTDDVIDVYIPVAST